MSAFDPSMADFDPSALTGEQLACGTAMQATAAKLFERLPQCLERRVALQELRNLWPVVIAAVTP